MSKEDLKTMMTELKSCTQSFDWLEKENFSSVDHLWDNIENPQWIAVFFYQTAKSDKELFDLFDKLIDFAFKDKDNETYKFFLQNKNQTNFIELRQVQLEHPLSKLEFYILHFYVTLKSLDTIYQNHFNSMFRYIEILSDNKQELLEFIKKELPLEKMKARMPERNNSFLRSR